MPRHDYLCPARRAAIRIFLCFSLPCAAALSSATPVWAEGQSWSVHAFGIKVGELKLSVSESPDQYTGTGSFRTTGLAGVLRRIRFTVSSRGRVTSSGYRPLAYEGEIDTGRRVSETRLDFSGRAPVKTSGAQSPAVPIAEKALRGAHDPMTVMWQSLKDKTDATLCRLNQTQFDGTRLVRITLTNRTGDQDAVTCSGTYDRIGGYTADELAEMKTSPISVSYDRSETGWRATTIRVETRHGKASLYRQD
ncbi:DUF3108 domain-containing protein [Shimia sp.]|uniref:DUF3108 domain-containing protein n=1 Tax=Shimia sp. TaxID=1954381 RepID=UPI00329A28E3